MGALQHRAGDRLARAMRATLHSSLNPLHDDGASTPPGPDARSCPVGDRLGLRESPLQPTASHQDVHAAAPTCSLSREVPTDRGISGNVGASGTAVTSDACGVWCRSPGEIHERRQSAAPRC